MRSNLSDNTHYTIPLAASDFKLKVDDTLIIFWRLKQAPVAWCQKLWHTLPENDTDKN